MYGRKVKLRFFFIFLIAVTLSLTIFLILKSLEENVVYFKSPSEIKTLSEMQQKKIRIGGMVKTDSISIVNKELSFVSLYLVIKNQYEREKNKFIVKYGNLNSERAASARLQRINREILSNTSTI